MRLTHDAEADAAYVYLVDGIAGGEVATMQKDLARRVTPLISSQRPDLRPGRANERRHLVWTIDMAAYLALSLVPLMVAVVFSVGLAISRSDVDWGSAAEWAAAIGTLAASS